MTVQCIAGLEYRLAFPTSDAQPGLGCNKVRFNGVVVIFVVSVVWSWLVSLSWLWLMRQGLARFCPLNSLVECIFVFVVLLLIIWLLIFLIIKRVRFGVVLISTV